MKKRYLICIFGMLTALLIAPFIQAGTGEGIIPAQWNVAPSFAIAAPSGYSPGGGVLLATIAGNMKDKESNGGMGVGIGFGDAIDGLGGSISVVSGGLSSNFLNRSSIAISLGHTFQESLLGVSIGMSDLNFLSNTSMAPSFYVSTSQYFDLPLPFFVTLGLGTNVYANLKTRNTSSMAAFAAAATYITPTTSLIIDYTSGILSIGTSMVPFQDRPVVWDINVSGFSNEYNNHQLWFNTSLSIMLAI